MARLGPWLALWTTIWLQSACTTPRDIRAGRERTARECRAVLGLAPTRGDSFDFIRHHAECVDVIE